MECVFKDDLSAFWMNMCRVAACRLSFKEIRCTAVADLVQVQMAGGLNSEISRSVVEISPLVDRSPCGMTVRSVGEPASLAERLLDTASRLGRLDASV